MEKKFALPLSEVFYSLEGEGPLTGVPTVFIRSWGCNLSCPGFSRPPEQAAVPLLYAKEQQTFIQGCDSAYAWHKNYADRMRRVSPAELEIEMLNAIGEASYALRARRALSLTGGEPMLHQAFFAEWIDGITHSDLATLFSHILIETNATIGPSAGFQAAIERALDRGIRTMAMLSPKLSISGEPHEKTIKPQAVAAFRHMLGASNLVFKFVSDGSSSSADEILSTLEELGAHHTTPVYVMPVAASREQLYNTQRAVADMCLRYGFCFSNRLHVQIWDSETGK